MESTSADLRTWIKALPASNLTYPKSFTGRIKYHFWRAYTPYHFIVRDVSLSLGIIKHTGRQNFYFGTIVPHLTTKEFITQLIDQGFGNHFFAWKDDGEIVSLRYVEDFEYQYHLRVFSDREVRGHYECTPECHPIIHMRDDHMEERRDMFMRFLEGKIA